jgi:plasmid stability protein
MATLHVRGVPDDLYEELTDHARDHGTSVTKEAIRLLRRALDLERRARGHKDLIDAIIADRPSPRPGSPSGAELIREDRDTR